MVILIAHLPYNYVAVASLAQGFKHGTCDFYQGVSVIFSLLFL